MGIVFYSKHVITNDRGKAWLDEATFQVIRLERIYGVPKNEVAVVVDYAETAMDGKAFWMPRTVTTTLTKLGSADPPKRSMAEYSGYRKFTSSSSIRYEP